MLSCLFGRSSSCFRFFSPATPPSCRIRYLVRRYPNSEMEPKKGGSLFQNNQNSKTNKKNKKNSPPLLPSWNFLFFFFPKLINYLFRTLAGLLKLLWLFPKKSSSLLLRPKSVLLLIILDLILRYNDVLANKKGSVIKQILWWVYDGNFFELG